MHLDELLGADKSEGCSSSEDWEDVAADGKGQPSPGTANRQVGHYLPPCIAACMCELRMPAAATPAWWLNNKQQQVC